MGPFEYIVQKIDGDYAQLVRVDAPDEAPNPVAMALLPFGVDEGMHLRWENFEYTIL